MNINPVRQGLRDLSLSNRYRSDRSDIVQRFYVPAFKVATEYSRAVGYFTSTSLALYARGIEIFAARGGRMRLIASPHLNEDDVEDIERGYDARTVISRAAERALMAEERNRVLDGLGTLGRLIAKQRLDIKLAFVEMNGSLGIYHEKLGIFRDARDDIVAFTGSSNETLGGLAVNFESVEVYRGWIDGDSTRASAIGRDFEELWTNRTPSLRVTEFPQVAREHLIKLGRERVQRLPIRDNALGREPLATKEQGLEVPSWLTVRRYQQEAVEAWLRQQGRGMLKMATGTGKTKTSMIAATKLARALKLRREPLVVLVLAPLQHLVDQWIDEIAAFGVRPVAVYESSQRWLPQVEEQLAQLRLGQRSIVTMVATNRSFSGAKFQSILARVSEPLLLIADEAHNLGSAATRAALPPQATYRLALSATPERWFDDEGTDALQNYFGPIAYELGLGDAIELGALCRYIYRPRLVELDESETQLYVDLSARIAALVAAGEDLAGDADSPLGQLLRKRANVLGHAAGKIPMLKADLDKRKESWFHLIYCAEGHRPSSNGEVPGSNQLSEVMRTVGNDLRLPAHSYVSETPRAERKVLLQRFGTGDDLKVLVAMRCLDEGVDIPDSRTGYLLASSSNPRQFIQRRGRLLRPAAGKDYAEIIDYLAVPRISESINFELERRLLIREFERANEFGKLSDNYEETLEAMRPIKERYQLMHL